VDLCPEERQPRGLAGWRARPDLTRVKLGKSHD
jgi:hypothetical protein